MAVHIEDANASTSTAVSSSSSNSTGGAHVTHLYTFTPGLSCQSFGTVCAALNGVPARVVERAVQLGRGGRHHGGGGVQDMVELVATLGEGEAEELEAAEGVARRFLEVDFGGRRLEGEGEEGAAEGLVEEVDWMGVLEDILST